jgi:glycosyltransferase involved in cell wall biosynthesis
MSDATVAVIIPFGNYERTLEWTIQSVRAQTYRPLTIVLVDDGSTDASGALAQRHCPPAVYVRRQNGGAGAARNTGVMHTRSEFIAFCDADDLWSGDKLARQMAVVRHDPRVDVVFASVSEFWSSGQRGAGLRPGRTAVAGALPSAMLIRRSAFERIGPFAEGWRIGEWADWYTRMRAAQLNELWMPDVLVQRRLHADANGVRQTDARWEYVRIMRAHLHRRRAHGRD